MVEVFKPAAIFIGNTRVVAESAESADGATGHENTSSNRHIYGTQTTCTGRSTPAEKARAGRRRAKEGVIEAGGRDKDRDGWMDRRMRLLNEVPP